MTDLAATLEFPDSVPGPVQQAIRGARLLHDAAAVDFAVDQVAVRMAVQLHGRNPLFLTVLHGGLVFAGMLMRRLVLPCQFGYVHASRYGDALQGGELHWIAAEHPPLAGRCVVLLDDILDEGKTLELLSAWAVEQGASEVHTAVLVQRTASLRSHPADYVGLQAGPGFLVGCGMDMQGYGRNLPGIYMLQAG